MNEIGSEETRWDGEKRDKTRINETAMAGCYSFSCFSEMEFRCCPEGTYHFGITLREASISALLRPFRELTFAKVPADTALQLAGH